MANAQSSATVTAGVSSTASVGSTPAGSQAFYGMAEYGEARYGSGVAVTAITVND